jgi:Zn-dependent membrane protease YugP
MFKAQFKKNSPYEKWSNIGSYGTENRAVAAAIRKKTRGVVLVRVVDRKGSVIYSN